MINLTKAILYLGKDSDFYNEICQFILNYGVGEFKQEKMSYTKGVLVKSYELIYPKIVLVDFTTLKEEDLLIEEILYVKRNDLFKDTLFVAVFDTAESLVEHHFLLTSGFQLFHIKGNELQTILRDSFYIAFNDQQDFPAYAKARKIDKPIQASACSTISSCDNTHFYVESDLECTNEELHLKLPMFPELTAEKFNIKTHGHVSLQYPMATGYCLELPIAGPWSDITTDLIQQDTLETWRSHHGELLKIKNIKVKVFSQNPQIFVEIYPAYNSEKFHLEFYDDINISLLAEDLLINETELIFYDLPIKDEESRNMEKLGELISIVSSLPHTKPIIVSSRNPSKTAAIQKLFNYSNIVCTDKPLSHDMYSALATNYLGKRKIEDSPCYQLPPTFIRRAVDVNFEVELTSLTEHEITFYSTFDLPMYTLLHFKLPKDFIATVVPPIIDLPNRSDSKQYMAFINGLDEKGAAELRIFVNKIIYKPLENYDAETIALTHQKMRTEKNPYDANVCEMPTNRFETKDVEYTRPVKFEKRFAGKSKL